MSDKWFYTHANAVHGPVPRERLFALARSGGLLPDDLVWTEAAGRAAAVPARVALAPPAPDRPIPTALPVGAAPVPEWLRVLTDSGLDLRTLEKLPPPPADAWLEDVRSLEQPSCPAEDGGPSSPPETVSLPPPKPPALEEPPPGKWPASQDYNEAIQSPDVNFADPDLQGGDAVLGPLGIPLPHSGNFADVYQVCCPDDSRWAVKCFTRQAANLRVRYEEISKHLRLAHLPFTVDFAYLEEGLRVGDTWYPVLKMRWVDGLTLNQFVGQYADNPAMLDALLSVWKRMARRLREAEVGHGDIQHGNVLLAPGDDGRSVRLKLIDYDGLWVPALAGRHSGEVGHPSYQHPQRIRERAYGPEVDRFPLLLVATALRALRGGGRPLWEKYDSGDGLLFRQVDLEAPTKSALFHDLVRSPDALTTALTHHVLKALRGGLESVPLLEEVLP